MTRLEAIEKTISVITSLDKFLNAIGPEHPINVVDPAYGEETLSSLAEACQKANLWLQGEHAKEEENDTMTHEEKKRELCIKDSDF